MCKIKLAPQPGPQTKFLESSADIVIYGGGAGGGKTFALLMESLRHRFNPTFKAIIFRRNLTDALGEGGIWSDTESLFPSLKAKSNENKHRWTFPDYDKLKVYKKNNNIRAIKKELGRPTGATISFGGLQHEKDKLKYQGKQLALICFDELTHFTKSQFFYMISRNRLGTGAHSVRPYIRATCNPDPDSWVKKLISWWLDEKTGYAIPERSGVVRHFVREGNDLIWFDSQEEAKEAFPKRKSMSLTFIPSSVFDNPALLEKDPDYLNKLEVLSYVDRMQLLGCNWKVKAAAGDYYKRENIPIIDFYPDDLIAVTRYWDRASTEESEKNSDPDYTSGTLFGRTKRNTYCWIHQERIRARPGKVLEVIKKCAEKDLKEFPDIYWISLEQDPGSAGVSEIDWLTRELSGFPLKVYKPTKGNTKIVRQKPLSSQVERKNVEMVKGEWNDELLDELEAFPEGAHDDQVDTSGGAFNSVALNIVSNVKEIRVKNKVKVYQK